MHKVLIVVIAFGSFLLSFNLQPAFASCASQEQSCVRNAVKCMDQNKCLSKCEQKRLECKQKEGYIYTPDPVVNAGGAARPAPGGSSDNGGGGTAGKSGDGKKKVAKDYDPTANWNGKYTMIVLRDARGTTTFTFKQGVDPNEVIEAAGTQANHGWNRAVLGPDGHKYVPWDPKLGELLVAAGVVDSKGNPITNANDVTAKEMYAKAKEKREQEAKQKYLDSVTHTSTSGYKTPIRPPAESDSASVNASSSSAHPGTNTGTAGSTHPSSSGPIVHDHRHPEPPRASAPPARPPVVLTGTKISDHRKKSPQVPGSSTSPAPVTAAHPPAAAGGSAGTSPEGMKYQAK